MIVLDPGRIDRPGRSVRILSLLLVAAIASGAAWSAGRLVWDLLHGKPGTTVALEPLVAAALVWLQTIIAFGFLYWELDNGGPVTRHLHPREHPDLRSHSNSTPPWRHPDGDRSSSTTSTSR
ncbi:hypothetical protein [Rhodococcus gannanensis]|uniref:Uncharacterized protein n=1 Tax=Rhodococcus gannanensis TaxID=1960308 RepID=A0ABW4P625_9NOCA